MIKSIVKLVVILGIACSLSSCKKGDVGEPPFIEKGQRGAIILNEGNFGWGNADFGYFDLDKQTFTDKVFQETNGRPLGDVLQSVLVIGSEMFLVLNNSATIEVVSTIDFKHLRSLSNMGSPRYLVPIANSSDAFVTDIYANEIKRVNLQTGAIVTKISLKGWHEEIVMLDPTHYVFANLQNKKLYVISSQSNELTDSFVLNGSIANLQRVGDNIFLLDKSDSTSSRLISFNGTNLTNPKVIFTTNSKVERIAMVNQNSAYLQIEEQLVHWTLSEGMKEIATLPANAKIYSINYLPKDKTIWLTDAVDYVSKGKVYVYSATGQDLLIFKSGPIPSKVIELE